MKNSEVKQMELLKSNKAVGLTIGMNLGGLIGAVVSGTMLIISGSNPIVAVGLFLVFAITFTAIGGFMGFLFMRPGIRKAVAVIVKPV